MRRLIAASFLAVLSSGTAQADFLNGNKLWEQCQEPTYGSSFCTGFVVGVVDGQSAFKQKPHHFCVPEKVTSGQVVDVAKLYIERNPQKRHIQATFMVIEAMMDAFPCAPGQ